MNLIIIFLIGLISYCELSSQTAKDSTFTNLDSLAIITVIPKKTELKHGEPLIIAVNFQIIKNWHIYWRNPGDSGLETKFEWDLGEDFTLINTRYEIPHKHTTDEITDYIYDNNVTYFFEFAANPNVTNDKLVKGKLSCSYLICNEICIPKTYETTFEFDITSNPQPDPSWFNNETFFKYVQIEHKYYELKNEYKHLDFGSDNESKFSINKEQKTITFEIEKATFDEFLGKNKIDEVILNSKPDNLLLFPYINGVINNSANLEFEIKSDKILIKTKIDDYATTFPKEITVIFINEKKWNDKFKAFEITFTKSK